jgi:hypothetical protein
VDQLHAQEAVFTLRNGANTAYCGLVGSGPSIERSFSTPDATHDIASVSDPGSTNWPASSAVSQLDATPSPSGITLSGAGSAQRDGLRPFIDFGVYATADARDSWEFTLAAPARFTLNASLGGSSTEALSPTQGYGFGGFAAGTVILDPGISPDALGGGLTGSGTRVRHARGRLLAGRYSISLSCRVEGTTFPFSGSFNSVVALELAPDVPAIVRTQILPQGMEFKWTDLGAKQYTVETSNSLLGDNWTPVSGMTWPVSNSVVVLPVPTTFPAFYRVKME